MIVNSITEDKILRKLICIMIIISLTFANFIFLTFNLISNAINDNLDLQNVSTNNANVEFDTFFNRDNRTHYLVGNVKETENLNIYLKVKDGYLKNGNIEFINENNKLNYKLYNTEDLTQNEMVQNISENKIELKKLDTSSEKLANISIIENLDTNLNINSLNQNSKAILKGIYVNSQGKEIYIEKEIILNIGWTESFDLNVAQNVSKYIKIDEQSMLLQTEITLSKENNKLPLKETNLEITVPQINEVLPKAISVSAVKTELTNGKTEENVIFTTENWTHNVEENKIIIKTTNKIENDSILVGNKEDKYIITYVYETQGDEILVQSNLKAACVYYTDKTIGNINKEVNLETSLTEEIGELISVESNSIVNQIYKGKIYSNENIEYTNRIKINSVDEKCENIIIQTLTDNFIDLNNKKYNLEDNNQLKSTKLLKTNFDQLLGQEGYIKILNNEGTELFNISNTSFEEEALILNYEENTKNIIIETSKLLTQGNLIIENTKTLNNFPYNKEIIKKFKILNSNINIQAKDIESNYTELGNKEINIELLEPITNLEMQMEKNTLATISTNENINMVLKFNNNSDTSDLYKNPEIYIRFPEVIKDINVKEINLLYDNELNITNVDKYFENKNLILKITTQGEQTKINSNNITSGTNIVINADIKLNEITPSKEEKIEIFYTNQNVTEYKTSIENLGYTENKINIVAPIGLLNISEISNFDNNGTTIASVEQGEKLGKISIFSPSRTATMNIYVINNNQNTCNEVVSLGRIPFKDNKNVLNGENLGTTVNSILKSKINPVNIEENEITIYYSENGEATNDLTNELNLWNLAPEDLSKVKSYLIVVNKEVQQGEIIKLSYNFEIPNNLEHNNYLFGSFGTSYINNTNIGALEETSIADKVGLTTGIGAELQLTQTVSVGENNPINEFQRVKYSITVKNVGDSIAEKVNVNTTIPEHTDYTYYQSQQDELDDGSAGYIRSSERELNFTVTKLNPNEIKTFEFEVEALNLPTINEIYANKPVAELVTLLNLPSEEEVKRELGVSSPLTIDEIIIHSKLNGVELPETYSFEDLVKLAGLTNLLPIPKTDIVNKVTLTAENLEGEIVNTITNELRKSELAITENINSLSIRKGKNVTLNISVENETLTDLNNLIIKKTLPEELNFIESYISTSEENKKAENVQYNSSTRELTWTFDGIKSEDIIGIEVVLEPNISIRDQNKKVICINTQVQADNTRIYTSNNLYANVIKPELKITQVCDVTDTYISVGDELTYTFTVSNIGEDTASNIIFKDNIPEELDINSIEITVNGQTTRKVTGSNLAYIMTNITVGDTLTVKITVNVVAKLSEAKQISNYATIELDSTTKLESTKITHIIEESTTDTDNNEEITYKTSGLAWLDKNENGQREDEEELLKDILVRLLDLNTNSIVKETRTDTNGKYSFTGIKKGRYIVIFEYNSSKYIPTQYRKEGVNEAQNSDAVLSKITENGKIKTVALTNTISITDKSAINVDIGLIEVEQFNLSLNKRISKVTVKNNAGIKNYDFAKDELIKIEIPAKQLASSTAIVEYRIQVKNEGQVAGYAKNIVDYIPKGMTFNSNLNPEWYIGTDNNLYNSSLANTLIQPGETKELILTLVKNITENNLDVISNTAEIYAAYNQNGLEDVNSTPGNKQQQEDDMDSADIIISIKTGKLQLYIILSLTITVIIAASIITIKKYILPKNI